MSVLDDKTRDAVERAWRGERSAVLASVARRTRDIDLAEDAVQEATDNAGVAAMERGH